jgi:hypothetical protein
MPRVKIQSDGAVIFLCPGCNRHVRIPTKGTPPIWEFKGDEDHPTITPSILMRWDEGDEPKGSLGHRCHSYVTDGKIQFLEDCTHELAGKTVFLPDISPDSWMNNTD